MSLEQLYGLLLSSHVQAHGIVDTIQVPVVLLDEALCVVNANPAFLESFQVNRDDTINKSFLRLGNGQWNSPVLAELLQRVIPKSAALLGYEITHDFPKIGQRTMLVSARRLVHPDNSSMLLFVSFEDVTSARDREARQDLFAAEIRHRFKNFLALVSSLARQSPSDGLTAQEYRDTLLGRIDALAEAELLVFGAKRAPLKAVLERVTTPYCSRVELSDCPEMLLDARQAASLSMILHELATNATKYGALSVQGGRVNLNVSVTQDVPAHVNLWWEEHGGPRTKSKPTQGFGSRLIQMIAHHQLGGNADINFTPEGLVARIEIPASAS